MPEERNLFSILSDFKEAQDAGSAGGSHQIEIGSKWLQGRATFGGVIGAMAARAGRVHTPQDRHLTSLQVTFAGPLGGQVNIQTELLRAGRSASLYQTRMTGSDGRVGAVASTAFGLPRQVIGVAADDYIDLPDRHSLSSMQSEGSFLPDFLKNMEIKWVGDGIPLSGGNDRRVRIWVRLREAMPGFDAERLVALADMPPPVILSHFKSWAPASSMTWSLDFVVPPETVTSEWLFLDYGLISANGGYSQQFGRIYSEDGHLLALSHQCMTYFEPKV